MRAALDSAGLTKGTVTTRQLSVSLSTVDLCFILIPAQTQQLLQKRKKETSDLFFSVFMETIQVKLESPRCGRTPSQTGRVPGNIFFSSFSCGVESQPKGVCAEHYSDL